MRYSHLKIGILGAIFLLFIGGFYTYYKNSYSAVEDHIIQDIKWEMYRLSYTLSDYIYSDKLSSFTQYMDNAININKSISTIEIADVDKKILLSTKRGRVGEHYTKELLEAEYISKENISKGVGYFMPIVYDTGNGGEIYYLIFETKDHYPETVLLKELHLMAIVFLTLILLGLALVYYITHRYISVPILSLIEFMHNKNSKLEKFHLKELEELKDTLLSYIDEVNFQKRYNRTILDSQQDIVIVTSGKGLKDTNKAFFEFFNEFKSLDEFKQKHTCVCEFFEADSRENFIQYNKESPKAWIETLINQPEIKHKVKITKNKTEHIFALSGKKMKKSNLFVVVFSNITFSEKYKNSLEQEITHKEKLLIQQSKLSTLGEMLGSISHQWKQPLNGISLMVGNLEELVDEGIKNSPIKSKIEKNLEQITNQIAFMSQTINDFRNFFKPSKERAEFSVSQVINEIYSLLAPQYRSHGISLKIIKDGEIDDIIDGFPSEFKQVILNLLNNTKDALDERKHKDEYKNKLAGDIEIEIKKSNTGISIIYSDCAGGIPETALEKMFTPYNTTKGDEGTGIGMYMSSQIVANMGGKIEVKNTQKGSCFSIYLPIT